MLTTRTAILVEWGHCDPARIIYNPNYYIWMDASTHALLKHAGFDLAQQILDPTVRGCPLVTSNAEFLTPAYFGDLLHLHSVVTKFGNKSFVVGHEFYRDTTLLCRGSETRVWGASSKTDPNQLHAIAVPAAIRSALSETRTVNTNY